MSYSIRNFFRREASRDDVRVARELVERGIAVEATGAAGEAMQLYRKAIEADPQFAPARMNLGIALHAGGDTAGAMACYRQAIALDPEYAAAHYNLGLAHLLGGEQRQAEASLREALRLRNDFPEARVALADALEALGRDDEALSALDAAIGQREQYVGALLNASALLRKMGRFDAADSRLREIDLSALFSSRRHVEAESVARQMIQAWPDHESGWRALGPALALQRRFEEALPAFEKAAELLPSDPETHNNLGGTLQTLGRAVLAEASYRRALELKPDYPQAHSNLGHTLQVLGRLAEAEASCRHALTLKPDCHEAHCNLGNALRDLGRLSEAAESCRRAIEIKPDFHEAHGNLGSALLAMGRIAEAEASLRRALALSPDNRVAYDSLLFLLNYDPNRPAEEIFAAYRAFDEQFGRPLRAQWRPHGNDRSAERRLRVGYVSPDFWNHSCRHFIEPILAHHEHAEVELFAYADVQVEDAVSERMKSRVEHWVSTVAMDDAQLAERIREDGIDILVDLAGHTRGNRLLAFARKPAPVSVSTLGYGYTTGLSAIDWYLTDAMVVPEGFEHLFSERPWRIGQCLAFRSAEGMGEVSPLPALQSGHVTFCTLTRAVRINHRTVRAWSEILRRVPGARLRIDSSSFSDAGLCRLLAGQFAAHGIGAERLQMGFHSPPWDVLRQSDIALDCFPHNSGTTLFESLYMGVPFITLAGRPSVGRLGASILAKAGHPEWIAASEAEYVDKAVALAADLARLAAVRARLRAQMQAGPLMDERGYVRMVEAAYRAMWRRWCAEQPARQEAPS